MRRARTWGWARTPARTSRRTIWGYHNRASLVRIVSSLRADMIFGKDRSWPGASREHLLTGLCNPHEGNLYWMAGSHHALDLRGGEPVAYQRDHLFDLEAMRGEDCLTTASRTGGEQFKCALASGRRAALAAACG